MRGGNCKNWFEITFQVSKRKKKQSYLKINSWSISFFLAFQKGKNRDGFFFFFFACMNETFPSFPPIFLSRSAPHFYHRNVIPPLTFLCGLFSVTQAWLGCRNVMLCLSVLLTYFPISTNFWVKLPLFISFNYLFSEISGFAGVKAVQIGHKHKAMPGGCGALSTERYLHNSAPPQPVNKKLT